MCTKWFRNVILVATCGSNWRGVGGGCRSDRGNVLVQEVPWRLNISSDKFRVMYEGHVDLDGWPGDGCKAKEMADVRDVQKKDIKVLLIGY